MPIIPFKSATPRIGQGVWIAPDSWIIGDSTIEDHVSVFFGAVLRGDILPVRVGAKTNLQEGSLLHTSTGLSPCIVGAEVTVGHHAIIHGCKVSDRCIIGMGSTILDGAEIGSDCIVGANTLVTMNTKIPSGTLVLGSPGKVVRDLSAEEIQGILNSAKHYCDLGEHYRQYFESTSTTRAKC